MAKNRKKSSLGTTVGLILLGVVVLTLVIAMLMKGNNIALFNSKGMIAHEQRKLIIINAAVMLAVAVPTLAFAYFTAWKYRESNSKAMRESKAPRSKLLVPMIWLVPTAVAFVLALIMWPATHKLDPRKSIASDAKPLTIQVIAMRWKWLFIYPEQHIASVNFVQIPVDTPVTFKLTADEAPMSSFWIPNLSGQLYAMTGHVNPINVVGNILGDYQGSSAEINGAGFADMKFTVRVGSQQAFDFWVNEAKLNGKILDNAEYAQILKPSEGNQPAYYSVPKADSDLYDTVLMKYMGPGYDMQSMETH